MKLSLTGADLTKVTPVEIDTDLYALYNEAAMLEGKRNQALHTAEYYETKGAELYQAAEKAAQYRELAAKIAVQLFELEVHVEPLNDEFVRRGGWTRAFLVNNSNGHVHRSMACSTCFPTTQYVWMVAYSGQNEAEIVADAGQRACTICYPTAPAETLSRPTKMFTPDEVAAQQERENRAAKKVAAASAAVLDIDGTVLFKTVRGATNQIASTANSIVWYSADGGSHPDQDKWIAEIRRILTALHARGDVEDVEEALKAALDAQIKKFPAIARKNNKEAVQRGWNTISGYKPMNETHPGVKY
jgi:hypothetical protein